MVLSAALPPPDLAVFGEIADLLRSHGPAEGQARFSAWDTFASFAHRSSISAASLLDQFERPFALERVWRLEELPRTVPYTSSAALASLDVPALVISARDYPVHPFPMAGQIAVLVDQR